MKQNLIRLEALNYNSTASIGTVTLVHPTKHVVIISTLTVLFLGAFSFLIFGEYTRHTTVQGVIEPIGGLSKLYAPQSGVVSVVTVREGDVVKRGQILIQAMTEHRNVAGQDVHEELDERARIRLLTLRKEINATNQLNEQEIRGGRINLALLIHSRSSILNQFDSQKLRTSSLQETYQKYVALRKSGFISEIQLSEKSSELLDQETRLEGLNKDLISIDGEISRAQREEENFPIKHEVSKLQYERNVATIQSEISQIKGEQSWSSIAPADGIVSTITIAPGQTVSVGTALVSILPKNSFLQAKLYTPSRALGFLRSGAIVKIRLEAYPYQKFGLATGRIEHISTSPTPSNELTSNANLMPKYQQNQEPLFSVIVKLDRDYVSAYGRREPLRVGMQLDGDIQIDTRRIYEWILEPLYSISGR